MVSSMGTRDVDAAGPMRPYCAGQGATPTTRSMDSRPGLDDRAPGRLTDEPGTRHRRLAPALGRRGEIPRDDVALVLFHCLLADNTIRSAASTCSAARSRPKRRSARSQSVSVCRMQRLLLAGILVLAAPVLAAPANAATVPTGPAGTDFYTPPATPAQAAARRRRSGSAS